VKEDSYGLSPPECWGAAPLTGEALLWSDHRPI